MLTKSFAAQHKTYPQQHKGLPQSLQSYFSSVCQKGTGIEQKHAIYLQLSTLLFFSQPALVTHQRLRIVIIVIVQMGYAIHPQTLAAA